MATPSTNIYICHVDFSNDYQHVVWFDKLDNQYDYFTHRVLKSFVDYSYIRKNWTLKVNATMSQAEKWNYLFFNQNGKTYYYFINNVEYISDDCVKLSLEMDVMQTYAFDYALQPSFVEREHSATDNVGDNTLDEELDVGTYTNALMTSYSFEKCVMMMTTASLDNYAVPKGEVINGVFSGCYVYKIKLDDMTKVNALFNRLNNDGKIDIILSMWMYDATLVDTTNNPDSCYELIEGKSFSQGLFVHRPNDFDGYVPKNNKLFTYPYNFIYATNNAGGCATYRYEFFNGTACEFDADGCIYPDGTIKFTPLAYKGVTKNYDESLNVASFPTCAWVSDTYKIWLAQNQNQLNLQGATATVTAGVGTATAVVGALTLNPSLAMSGLSMAGGGAMSIANLLAQKKDMEVQPPQARGNSSATLNASMNLFMQFYQRQITKTRAQIIDDFFTMYGYKTLRVKVPNRNVRMSFTYTKTVNCHITGSLCQDDIRKIQSVYDNGVTFWESDAAIGNYSADNSVLV